MSASGTILIADYDFGDVEIERSIIEGAGFESRGSSMQERGRCHRGRARRRRCPGAICHHRGASHRRVYTLQGHCALWHTGVDIVDVDAATRRNIQVTNAPNEWCADEVADHAVALWLAAARKICQYDRATRRDEWQWQTGQPIWRLRGRVLGLLSFGAIARAVA